jgi:hypothetical protein
VENLGDRAQRFLRQAMNCSAQSSGSNVAIGCVAIALRKTREGKSLGLQVEQEVHSTIAASYIGELLAFLARIDNKQDRKEIKPQFT